MMRPALLAALIAHSGAVLAEEPRFDPLSQQELAQIVELLVGSGKTNDSTRIARVTRLPGDKNEPPRRKARVVALLDGASTEIDIDLQSDALTFREIADGYAPITSNDWALARRAASTIPRMSFAKASLPGTSPVRPRRRRASSGCPATRCRTRPPASTDVRSRG